MTPPARDTPRAAASGLAAVVRRLGWRAYAVPILVLVTVVVLVRPGGSTAEEATAGRGDGIATVGTPAASSEELSAPEVLPATTNAGDTTVCRTNARAQWFVVSIRTQHAWACAGNRLLLSTPVTTGVPVPDRETRVGTWAIQGKQTDRDLVGPGYSEHVDYWMPYDGDFGLHDATWQTFAFGTDGWRTDGSHGCVHLPTDAMAWVYSWAQVGAVVTIDA